MTDPGMRWLGIGHLAAAGFPQRWDRTGDGAVAHLRRYLAADGRLAVAAYRYDAQCLLATGLSDEQLASLWSQCADGHHHPGRDGLTGREWMRIIHDATAEHADPQFLARLAAAGRHRELSGRVRTVVTTADDAGAALADIVDAGHPDLALRLFLTIVAARLTPLPAALFDEVTHLASRLELDPDILSGLVFLRQ